jgi:hypothetical protein
MFLPFMAFAAALFAADPATDFANLHARLGVPTPELFDCRIDVRKRGIWSAKRKEIYHVAGLNEEAMTEFFDSLMESAGKDDFQRRSRHQVDGGHRVILEASGKRGGVLQLASELNPFLNEGTCTYFCWNNSSLELRLAPRQPRPKSDDGGRTFGEIAASLILKTALTTAINEEMRRKGVTPDDWKAAIDKFEVKSTLTLTTDGKITADAPAEVSDDGKTLTLDLWKFQKDPPETWSIRIDGL